MSMMLANNQFINQNPDYIGKEFTVGVIPTVTAVVPLVYHIPTVCVIGSILKVYCESTTGKRDLSINPNLVFCVVLHQLSTYLCILFDYMVARIPSTGMLTPWCSTQEPSHFLKIVFWIPIYAFALSNAFPFMIAILRLLLIYYPATYEQKSQKLVRVSTPIILLYPLAITWFLTPALGVCRQLPAPYHFGAAYIHFIGSAFELKTAPFVMVSSTLWLLASILANAFLFRKLKRIGKQTKSRRIQRAELSLSLTTVMIIMLYIINFVFMIVFAVSTRLTAYLILFRSTGSDVEAVVVPWIFFLVHPAFKSKKFFIRRWIRPSRKAIDIHSVSRTIF